MVVVIVVVLIVAVAVAGGPAAATAAVAVAAAVDYVIGWSHSVDFRGERKSGDVVYCERHFCKMWAFLRNLHGDVL